MSPVVLHRGVLDAVGLAIVSGELTAGSVLTLQRLQTDHRVSRTVARETMRVLESMGLVASRRRVGLVVQPMSRWNVFDASIIRWRLAGPGRDAQLRTLTALRIAVEPAAAAAAARHASAAEGVHVVGLAARMRVLGEAGRLEEFLEVDVAFHTALLHAGRNEMFAALHEVVAEVLAGRTHLGLMPSRPVPQALDLHEEVAAAVRDGSPARARTAMTALVEEVSSALEEAERTVP